MPAFLVVLFEKGLAEESFLAAVCAFCVMFFFDIIYWYLLKDHIHKSLENEHSSILSFIVSLFITDALVAGAIGIVRPEIDKYADAAAYGVFLGLIVHTSISANLAFFSKAHKYLLLLKIVKGAAVTMAGSIVAAAYIFNNNL